MTFKKNHAVVSTKYENLKEDIKIISVSLNSCARTIRQSGE